MYMNMVRVLAFSLVAAAAMLSSAAADGRVAVKVGVVTGDMDELPPSMTWTTLHMALSDFYAANPNYTTRLRLHRRSCPSNGVLASASAVLDLIKNVQVQAIIGPETSTEAQLDMSLADKAQVPMITYAATSPLLLSSMPTPYFIQATQLDSAQISAISSIVQAFRWTQVVILYVRNEFGGGFIPALVDALQNTTNRAIYRSEISSAPTDDQIEKELYKLKSMDTRVFIVHMNPRLGSRLFSHATKIGMMDQDYAWIVTTGMANVLNSLKSDQFPTMQGVIGFRNYFPTTPELQDFVARWKRRIVRENIDLVDPKISVFQLWAYDAITALAIAVEKVRSSSFKFEKRIASSNISITDLSAFGVSKAGPELIRAIKDTRFTGFSGDFDLVDGVLRPSVLEIINVVGNGVKTVGFWTPQHGLSRQLKFTNSVSSGKQLGSIIWPGDRNVPPKGWVVSPNGKRLKVLVPVKDGFEEFVKVTPSSEPGLDSPQISGYCIDIFNAVMGSLPYPVSYEYIPYRKRNGGTKYSYDELITEVYNHRYDVVVGDVTIIANRSEFVDFTLPYTESGVTMVAPIKDKNKKKAWLFLTPLSWDLWVTSLCFFVFIAFVIWVFEHRINPQFRGPFVYQAGTSLYYSFSTMVFAHSQQVFSNATRFVVIIWVFLVLILTQCYTASLTSMLTIQQLQPTVTDVRELISTGKVVGYQEGSFVKDLLIRKGFYPSNLKPYKSPQELDDFFTKGSEKGGVAAAFDEIPYVNVFLASYCSKYVMVPPTYKTDGFGFVFPLGSPLLDDVSRKVLSVTEGDQMEAIERKWFGQNASCSDSTSTYSTSTSIGLDSFWGLFLIAGCVATFALIVSLVRFLYEYRSVWLRSDPNATIWGRVKELAGIFDQRNMSSHTFKISETCDRSYLGSPQSSPCPESRLSFSNHTESTSPGHLNQQALVSSSLENIYSNEVSVVEISNS